MPSIAPLDWRHARPMVPQCHRGRHRGPHLPRHDPLLGVYLARFVRPHSDEDVTYLRLAYGGTVGEADPTRSLDAPVQRTLWLSLDELRACQAQHRSALVLQCIEDHAAGRRFSLDAVQAHASLWAPEVKERA